jgi:co-chaperonin GroES (HSP10)
LFKCFTEDSIIVRREPEKERVLPSGIILPDQFTQGEAGLSPDRYSEVVDSINDNFKKGDIVVAPELQHIVFKCPGERLSKLPVMFIQAKVTDEGIVPVENYVLVAPDPVSDTVEGSFILKDDYYKHPYSDKGTVLAVGPDCELKVGARVLFNISAGLGVQHKGESCLLLREIPKPGFSWDIYAEIVDVEG